MNHEFFQLQNFNCCKKLVSVIVDGMCFPVFPSIFVHFRKPLGIERISYSAVSVGSVEHVAGFEIHQFWLPIILAERNERVEISSVDLTWLFGFVTWESEAHVGKH